MSWKLLGLDQSALVWDRRLALWGCVWCLYGKQCSPSLALLTVLEAECVCVCISSSGTNDYACTVGVRKGRFSVKSLLVSMRQCVVFHLPTPFCLLRPVPAGPLMAPTVCEGVCWCLVCVRLSEGAFLGRFTFSVIKTLQYILVFCVFYVNLTQLCHICTCTVT